MSKPLQDNLRNVRIIDELGDLRPLLDYAGEKLSDLVKAVAEAHKAGTLTLKIEVKPSTAGAQNHHRYSHARQGPNCSASLSGA